MTEKELKEKMLSFKMFVIAHKNLIEDFDIDFTLPEHEMIFIQGRNGSLIFLSVNDIDKKNLDEASHALRS